MRQRSACPISNALDFVGDKWSLLIIRDLIFFKKRSFSELQHSDEKIATNILSSRLNKLESDGLIVKKSDQADKRKKSYVVTEAGRDLLPILVEMIIWSSKHANGLNIPHDIIDKAAQNRNALLEELRKKTQRNE